MTLEIFSRDVVPIINILLAVGGIYFVVRQINIATETLERTSSWNKLQATYNFINLEKSEQLERILYDAGKKIGLEFKKRLTDDELNTLVKDADCFYGAKNFLMDFDLFCSAYQAGALDDNIAYNMLADRITKEYDVFEPFINVLRQRFKDPAILIELERTAELWSKRLISEKEGIRNKVPVVVKKNNL